MQDAVRSASMKILLYGMNFSPELTGIGKYTGEMADWLAAQGHELRVVTAPPYYPNWRVWPGYRSYGYRAERAGEFAVYRCPLWVPRSPSGFKRIIHLCSFALSSLPIMLRHVFWRPEVVWVVAPTLACAPTALVTARLAGARAWLHIQDFELDAAFGLGMFKGGHIFKWARKLEGWVTRRFDRVSAISSDMVAQVRDRGVEESRVFCFPNWVDTTLIRPLDKPSAFRGSLGIPDDAIVALYSGNMGEKQGLEILAEAATRLANHTGLYFVFCGDGAGRQALFDACQGLEHVFFLALQPLDRLNELLGLADIHLLPQRAGAAGLVMPSKLTGMLASGKAIVSTAGSQSALAKAMEGCGIVVPPSDAAAFAAAISRLAEDKPLRTSLGQQARKVAVQEFSKETVLARFGEQLA